MQPWHFCVVSNAAAKKEIRAAAEEVERAFYEHRAAQQWLDALEPLGTDAEKPFLETAPYLIVIFAQRHGLDADGTKVQHYHVNRSVGIATGFLIAALHTAGLAMLTYTPSPMHFLNDILDRPQNEHPFLVLVVGYPAADAEVPQLQKKSLQDIATFI
jgi:nitroreductase